MAEGEGVDVMDETTKTDRHNMTCTETYKAPSVCSVVFMEQKCVGIHKTVRPGNYIKSQYGL